MATPNTVSVQVHVFESAKEPMPAQLEVHALAPPERVMRGLKRLGAIWVAAVLCVFIPLLHFVLVPGLLLAGPWFAWQAARVGVTLNAGAVTCPKCLARVPVEEGTPGWPAQLHCAGCGTRLEVRA